MANDNPETVQRALDKAISLNDTEAINFFQNRLNELRPQRDFTQLSTEIEPPTRREGSIFRQTGVLPQRFAELSDEEFATTQAPRISAPGTESLIFPSREDRFTQPGYGATEVIYEGIADPILQELGIAGDIVIRGANLGFDTLTVLQNILNQEELLKDLDKNASFPLPSEAINSLRNDISQTLEIQNDALREEIALKKVAEYSKFFQYYLGVQSLRAVPLLGRVLNPIFRATNKAILKNKPLFATEQAVGVLTETEIAARGGDELQQAIGGGVTTLLTPLAFNTLYKTTQKLPTSEFIKTFSKKDYNNASEQLQNIINRTPEETLVRLRDNAIAAERGAPFGIVADDPNLNALEAYLFRLGDGMFDINERNRKYLQNIANLLGERSKVSDAATLIRIEKDMASNQLDALINMTTQKELDNILRINPDTPPALIQEKIFNALNYSFERARLFEANAWAKVDLQKSAFKYNNSRKALQDIIQNIGEPKKKFIPKEAIQFLSEPNKLKTVNDLYSLYSVLGQTMVNNRLPGESKITANIAQQLREAIFEDLDKISGTSPQLRIAKDTTRLVKQKFEQGTVGKILSQTKDGSQRIDPTLSLETVKKGQRGALTIDEIASGIRGIEPSPITREVSQRVDEGAETINEFYRNLFVRKATRNGVVIRNNALNFLNDHAEFLNKPENAALKFQLKTAVDDIDVLRSNLKGQTDFFKSRFDNKGKGAVNKFLNADIDDRMSGILFSGDPVGKMKELVSVIKGARVAAFKGSGVKKVDALQGLKDSVYETVIKIAQDKQPLDGSLTLTKRLQNKEFVQALEQVLNKKEINNLKLIAKDLDKFNNYKLSAPENIQEILEKSSFKDQIIASIAGVTGGRLTPGPAGLMITAGVKRQTLEILRNLRGKGANKVLVAALQDPKLMEALLLNNRTYERGKNVKVANYLSRYFIGRSADMVLNDDSPSLEAISFSAP